MENNIFAPVVKEDANAANANTVVVLQLLVVVTPVADIDCKKHGLNG